MKLKDLCRDKKIKYSYAFFSALCFALVTVLSKFIISNEINAIKLVFYQYLFVSIITFFYIAIKDIRQFRIPINQLILVFINGIIGSAGATIFYYLALEHLDASLVSALFFCSPSVIYVYSLLSKKNKVSLVGVISLISCLIGSFMVIDLFGFGIKSISVLGVFFGILACMCYSFFNIFIETKIRDISPIAFDFYTAFVVLFVSIIMLVFMNQPITCLELYNVNIAVYILFLALCSGVLPIILTYMSIKNIGANKTAVISTSELPITIILSYIFLGENMKFSQITGCLVIIFSINTITKQDQL